MTQVIIAGGGPTGLMLAYELTLAGIEVRLVDKLPRRSPDSRAGGMHARTMEVLDQRGIADDFDAAGWKTARGHFATIWLDYSGFDTRYNYMLGLVQSKMEVILEEKVNAAGVEVEWASEVVGVQQDADGVAVEIQGPQ
ncbi:MAG TPA: FAD-dependent monooxygenase, partial [Stackebrandtia sp.]|uniref:FAD-dependent monooxygenase n=1 Tax=Stackebrandtia sp. TaxID=2023065 RepID=UPI002D612EB6